MRKLVVLVAVLASGGLWADWFCDSLEIKDDQINIKPIYVEIIKNYCDKTMIDLTGKCYLVEFGADGSASVKEEHIVGVKAMCAGSSCTTTPHSEACVKEEEEHSWFVELLISIGNSTPHWRR